MPATHTPDLSAPSDLPRLPGWQRVLLWGGMCLALVAVFALYLQPDFMVRMADYVWACL